MSHPILIQQAPHPSSGRLHARGLDRGYTGLYEGSRKVVVFDDGAAALFDLEDDPGEDHDLSGAEHDVVQLMRAHLGAANATHPRRWFPSWPDPDVQERLRAGGYVR